MVSQRVGGWAFILGVVIAIIAGLVAGAVNITIAGIAPWVTLVLVILGLIVGFLNLNDKEMQPFLVAAIALMLVGSAQLTLLNNVITNLGTVIQNMIYNITAFVAPAALVVALKSVYRLAARPTKA